MGHDRIEHTCEVFVQLHNILDEKVGASVIAGLNPTYFPRKVEDLETNITQNNISIGLECS